MVLLLLTTSLYEGLMTSNNAPMEEFFVPSLKNYDYYINGSYGRGWLPSASFDFNSVPGPARLSILGATGVKDSSLYSLLFMNYSRYMGMVDLGFNFFLYRYEYGDGPDTVHPGFTFNLFYHLQKRGVGGGISYLSMLPLISDAPPGNVGFYVFYHRGDFHRGGKGLRAVLGYVYGTDREVQFYASFRFRGIYPFFMLRLPSSEYRYLSKAGLRLTLHRFNLYGGVLIGDGRRVGYVLSLGTHLPR